ncbi:hypothetical protein B0T17DRAFT_123007 [Bombardia bombarda]|uniref:Uncharacterized protein n=1 Tax=Bombardia bombarda TaxID=252184 RepID=A0AA39TJV1_9PEZI|nr:hypothetical protein B0T17DRAFT_123007 [Bombardia bombarda]
MQPGACMRRSPTFWRANPARNALFIAVEALAIDSETWELSGVPRKPSSRPERSGITKVAGKIGIGHGCPAGARNPVKSGFFGPNLAPHLANQLQDHMRFATTRRNLCPSCKEPARDGQTML